MLHPLSSEEFTLYFILTIAQCFSLMFIEI